MLFKNFLTMSACLVLCTLLSACKERSYNKAEGHIESVKSLNKYTLGLYKIDSDNKNNVVSYTFKVCEKNKCDNLFADDDPIIAINLQQMQQSNATNEELSEKIDAAITKLSKGKISRMLHNYGSSYLKCLTSLESLKNPLIVLGNPALMCIQLGFILSYNSAAITKNQDAAKAYDTKILQKYFSDIFNLDSQSESKNITESESASIINAMITIFNKKINTDKSSITYKWYTEIFKKTSYAIYTDVHMFSPTVVGELPTTREQVLAENAIYLGDNIDRKNATPEDLPLADKLWEKQKEIFQGRIVSGNHEVLGDNDNLLNLIIDDICFVHGDILFWDKDKWQNFRNKPAGHGFSVISKAISVFRDDLGVDIARLSKEDIKNAISFAKEHNCTKVITGHKHPTDTIVHKAEGITIYVLKRGKNILAL